MPMSPEVVEALRQADAWIQRRQHFLAFEDPLVFGRRTDGTVDAGRDIPPLPPYEPSDWLVRLLEPVEADTPESEGP